MMQVELSEQSTRKEEVMQKSASRNQKRDPFELVGE